MSVRKIWFDLSFAPLVGVVGMASFLMGGIIMKHFSGHTDVAFDKKIRMDHNHQGGSEHRIATHNSRLGMLSINKRAFNLFPFTYTPKAEIIDRHRTDK